MCVCASAGMCACMAKEAAVDTMSSRERSLSKRCQTKTERSWYENKSRASTGALRYTNLIWTHNGYTCPPCSLLWELVLSPKLSASGSLSFARSRGRALSLSLSLSLCLFFSSPPSLVLCASVWCHPRSC